MGTDKNTVLVRYGPLPDRFLDSVYLRALETDFFTSVTYGSFHSPARNIAFLREKGANLFCLLLRSKLFSLVAFLAALARSLARYDKLLAFNVVKPLPEKPRSIHFVRQV